MIIDIEILKKDLIRIENRQSFLITVPQIHPDNPQYTKLWTQYMKWCIEGFWAYDNGGWRFMPPTLFFYGNFFKLEDTDKNKKIRTFVKPAVRDLDWLIHYSFIEAQGFSGFKNDDKISCDIALVKPELYEELERSENMSDKMRFNDLHSKSGKRKIYEHPRSYLKRVHDDNFGRPLYYNRAYNLMLLGCLGEDVKVRMFDGSVKCVQNICVGDKLMGPDSKERNVLSIFNSNAPLYNISTRYGESFQATDTHLLRLREKNYTRIKGKPVILEKEKNISVGDFLDKKNEARKELRYKYEALSAKVQYPHKELMLDPYLLGLWLGDGFKREKMICGSYEDLEILTWLKNHAVEKNYGSYISDYSGGLGKKLLWRFSWSDPNMKGKSNWFAKTLQNNKHIPQEYIINSEHNRLKLLAGMIDSDGSYEKGRFTITNIDLSLLKQFQDVARSLGFRAKIHKPSVSGITNSLKYNLRISGDISNIPTQLQRKKAVNSTFGKGSNLNSINIEFIGVKPFYGIEIDQDNLFLLEDYTVTHNSRGGGKSYSCAGIATHTLTFDGIKEFSKEVYDNPPTTKVILGAGITGKSAELVNKITTGLNVLGTDNDLGVWGDPMTKDYEPTPFYRNWVGDSKPGNTKNPLRYEYQIETPQGWLTRGTKTSLHHINYSDKKQDGTQAGAGGRAALCLYEEIGLMPNFKDALLSNTAVVSVDAEQVGVQLGIGTSGNIDLIQQTRQVFDNPLEYDFLPFDNVWEQSDKPIGLFIPAYLTEKRFKDSNGNTDFERALKYYEERRLTEAAKDDPAALYNEKMNYPLIPSDMWVSNKGSYFPQIELLEREKELLKDQKYKTLATPTKLIWDSKFPNGVRAEYDSEIELFYTFPYDRTITKLDGGIAIYEKPQTIRGEIPNDMYIATFDPYVSENIDEGGSLGVTKVFLNPKYTSEGFNGNYLVATYIGKHSGGKDAYYENQEKLLAYYGNPYRGLWYEANRGDSCRGYYMRKKKLHLLALRPNKEKGSAIFQNKVLEYGVTVGNQIDKIEMIDDTSEWLLSHTVFNGKKCRVVEAYPCLFTIQQYIQFELKGNFDAVSADIIYPLALKELEHSVIKEREKKHNPLAILSMNPHIFKVSNILERIKQLNEQIKNET